MAHRTAIVEEEFDDDTDLPLPSFIPNTGARGPLLQEVDDNYEPSDSEDEQQKAGPASPPRQMRFAPQQVPDPDKFDMTPYKSWTCIYPIYLDAKRPYGTGQRRISRAKGVWWPLSRDITEASIRLGLGAIHEVNKAHPRDWENPGRVRVGWKKNGKLVNPNITTKKQLLEMISFQIQHLKPENIPKAPYALSSAATISDNMTSNVDPNPDAATQLPASASATSKGKQPLTTSSKSTSSAPLSSHPSQSTTSTPNSKSRQKPGQAQQQQKDQAQQKPAHRPIPVPPMPYPPLSNRISQHSPALSSGVLIETVKAGMNATSGGGAEGASPGMNAPGGAGKGKRKVVRVRG